MRKLIAGVVIFILVATIGLPLYLGPDDIATCARPTEAGACQRVDAIIAVSGGDTTARAKEAIKLYQHGWGDWIVFSGAAADKNGPSNAAAMRGLALDEGVPETVVRIEEFSNTTAENAENTSRIVEEMRLRRVMLVTSAYHQRRTSIEFSRYLGNEVAIVNHPVANDSQWSSWWWMTPIGWWLGIGELLKIALGYAGFGW